MIYIITEQLPSDNQSFVEKRNKIILSLVQMLSELDPKNSKKDDQEDQIEKNINKLSKFIQTDMKK